MSKQAEERDWPPFRPDYRLITLREKGRSEDEYRAIVEGRGPAEDEAAPEEAT